MNSSTSIASILLAAILTNNMVLSKFLGICPFLGVSKKTDTAFSMSVAVTLVMVVATAVTWPIYNYILAPDYAYLETIVFILVIAAIVQLIEIVLKRYIKPVYNALGIYLPLITTNCAVLGVALNSVTKGYNILESVVYGFATAFGFFIAIVLMAGVREKIEYNDIPKPFQGTAIVLLTACLMAIAFMGFSGMVSV